MAWTTPLTATSNSALTAAQWNASVRDNLLETGPAKVTASGKILVSTGANQITERTPIQANIDTAQTTTITSFGDLATAGPTVTVTTGTKALIMISTRFNHPTASVPGYMGYAVSVGSTLAAEDGKALRFDMAGTAEFNRGSYVSIRDDLTAALNTFQAKYKVGSGTGEFAQREIAVIPLS